MSIKSACYLGGLSAPSFTVYRYGVPGPALSSDGNCREREWASCLAALRPTGPRRNPGSGPAAVQVVGAATPGAVSVSCVRNPLRQIGPIRLLTGKWTRVRPNLAHRRARVAP